MRQTVGGKLPWRNSLVCTTGHGPTMSFRIIHYNRSDKLTMATNRGCLLCGHTATPHLEIFERDVDCVVMLLLEQELRGHDENIGSRWPWGR